MRLLLAVLVLVLAVGGWWLLRSPSSDSAFDDPVGQDGRAADGADALEALRLAGRRGAKERGPEAPPDATNAPAADGPARLLIEVHTAEAQKPVAQVRIVFVDAEGRRFEATTDGAGKATLDGLAPGEARGHAEAPGFVPSEPETVELEAGQAAETVIGLERGAPVRGYARRALDGSPIEGARVTATEGGSLGHTTSWSGRDPFGDAETDAEGLFRFPGLPYDQICTFEVQAPGYRTTRKCFIWHESEAERPPVEIRLEPGGRLTGRVRGRDGNPVPGATVEVSPVVADAPSEEDEQPMLRGVADEEGRYRVDGLAFGGLYGARATADGHATSELVPGLLPTADEPEVFADLRLRDPGRLVVLVADPEGRPLKDPSFTWAGETVVAGEEIEQTPKGTRFALGSLEPGSATLRVSAQGLLAVTRELDLPEGGTLETAVRLERGVTISGVVVDDLGEPLEGIHVHVTRQAARMTSTGRASTDEKGRFVIEGLEPGEYDVRAYAAWRRIETARGVEAPATGVRLVAARVGRVTFELVLPPGLEPPGEIWVGSYGDEGGSASTREWGSGTFSLDLRSSKRTIHVEGRGFAPFLHEVEVEAGEERDLGTFELTRGIELAGRVVDLAGKPIAGVALDVAGHTYGQASTGADGRFRIPFLNPEELQIDVQAEGYLMRLIELADDADRSSVRIQLAKGGLLRVNVRHEDGKPAGGLDAEVGPPDDVFTRDGYDLEAYEETDERGSFEARLPAGAYVIRILETEGEKPIELVTGKALLKEGETTEVELRLPAPR